jgi:hypothetical protein
MMDSAQTQSPAVSPHPLLNQIDVLARAMTELDAPIEQVVIIEAGSLARLTG